MVYQNICQPDEWYEEFEENIRSLVKALHYFGVRTIWSCEGHIRTNPCYLGVLPWPWVIIQTKPEVIRKLEGVFQEWNRLNPGYGWKLSVQRIHGSLTQRYIRDVMMREEPGTVVRALVPIEDNWSLSADVLAELQKSANELADFLRSR